MNWLKRYSIIIKFAGIAVCLAAAIMLLKLMIVPCLPSLSRVKIDTSKADAVLPFKAGEKTVYKIFFCGLPFGQSEAVFKGETVFNNQKVYQIDFSTKTLEFKDLENVYVDKKTFLPIHVARHIKKGRATEEITEDYDRQNGFINISKKTNARNELMKKACSKNVQNDISLFYYCRANSFKIGDTFPVSLPHKDYTLRLDSIERVKTRIGEFEAYLFKTEPDGVKFWISTKDPKLLLKAETSLPLGALTSELTSVSGTN